MQGYPACCAWGMVPGMMAGRFYANKHVLKTMHWQWKPYRKPMESKLSRLVPIEERDRLWVYCVELGSGKQNTKIESSWVWCNFFLSLKIDEQNTYDFCIKTRKNRCEKHVYFSTIRPWFFWGLELTLWVLRSPWSLSDHSTRGRLCRSVLFQILVSPRQQERKNNKLEQ